MRMLCVERIELVQKIKFSKSLLLETTIFLFLADFFTKAHPVHHHVAMMKLYLLPEEGVLM